MQMMSKVGLQKRDKQEKIFQRKTITTRKKGGYGKLQTTQKRGKRNVKKNRLTNWKTNIGIMKSISTGIRRESERSTSQILYTIRRRM